MHPFLVLTWNAVVAVSSDVPTLHAVPHSQRACEASSNRKKPENSIMSNRIFLQNPARPPVQPASSLGIQLRLSKRPRAEHVKGIFASAENKQSSNQGLPDFPPPLLPPFRAPSQNADAIHPCSHNITRPNHWSQPPSSERWPRGVLFCSISAFTRPSFFSGNDKMRFSTCQTHISSSSSLHPSNPPQPF